MINTKNFQLSIIMVFLLVACGNNRRPGLSDKELFAERQIDTPQQASEQMPDFSEMETYIVHQGIKYNESRAIDPANPPVVLDIANRNLSIRKFSLSDYYSNVRYVKIKHPLLITEGSFLFDATCKVRTEGGMLTYRGFNSQFTFSDDSIVAGDIFFGYHSYDSEGNFLHTIKAYDFQKVYNVSINEISCNDSDYRKAMEDNVRNSSSNRFRVNNETMASYVYNWRDTVSNDFLFTFNLRGDTLCRFVNYNPRYDPNKKRPPVSWGHPSRIYFYEQTLTVNQAINDTVYRVTGPNRIVPTYVINYGPYKLNIDLADDFSNKIFPDKWVETDKYILFTYNLDRDFPINRTNGIVKFFYSYYDKNSRQFYHFCEGTTIPDQQFLIENSIPDALPFMLSYANIYEKSLAAFYSKNRLKEIIKDKGFASLSSEQQHKLRMMQNELDDSEVLIMILE